MIWSGLIWDNLLLVFQDALGYAGEGPGDSTQTRLPRVRRHWECTFLVTLMNGSHIYIYICICIYTCVYIYIYISRAIHLGSILCALDEHTGAQAPRGCTELPPRASNPRRTPTGRLRTWWGELGLEPTTSRLQSYALYHLAPKAYIYIYIHAR